MLFERDAHEFCPKFVCNLRVWVCMTKRFINELTLNNIITARRPLYTHRNEKCWTFLKLLTE